MDTLCHAALVCCILSALAGLVRTFWPQNGFKPVINAVLTLYIITSVLHAASGMNWQGFAPSLTVAEIKNRCIPCVYWGTAIFVVVMKYSNLFFSFAFFLDRSHFAFGYELIISSEAAGFMKIICNGFTLI